MLEFRGIGIWNVYSILSHSTIAFDAATLSVLYGLARMGVASTKVDSPEGEDSKWAEFWLMLVCAVGNNSGTSMSIKSTLESLSRAIFLATCSSSRCKEFTLILRDESWTSKMCYYPTYILKAFIFPISYQCLHPLLVVARFPTLVHYRIRTTSVYAFLKLLFYCWLSRLAG